MQKFRRFLAAFASLVVGGASFALSYVALRDVSVRLGAVPANMGWLVPVVIDGGIICGSAIIWALSKEDQQRPKFPFFFVGAMVIMSVIVNIAHAGSPILAKVIASLPPVILLGTLEMVAGQGRRQSKQTSQTAESAPEVTEALTQEVSVVSVPMTAILTGERMPEPTIPAQSSPFDELERALTLDEAEEENLVVAPSRVRRTTATTEKAPARRQMREPAAVAMNENTVEVKEKVVKDSKPKTVKRPTTRPLRVSASTPE